MNVESHVVSSYEIPTKYQMELGESLSLRVGEKSPTRGRMAKKKNTSYTMDEAITKLRCVLREMKDQDKSIYRQLMTLNTNIKRLKGEVETEGERRNEFDIEMEDSDVTEDSDSEFEMSENEENECENEAYKTMRNSTRKEEADNDSIHDRFDSGILEDASNNTSHYSIECPARSPIPKFDDNNNNTNTNNNNNNSYNVKELKCLGEPKRYNVQVSSPINFTATRGDVTQTRKPELAFTNDQSPVLQRSQTMKMSKTNSAEKLPSHKMHRRSHSEDQIKFDVKSNFDVNSNVHLSARERYQKRQLGDISENGKGPANGRAFDGTTVKSTDQPRVLKEQSPAEERQFGELMQQNKRFNSSLTQLNLHGAISNGALRAIKKSLSMDGEGVNSFDDLSLVPKRNTGDQNFRKVRNEVRLIKTASVCLPGFEDFGRQNSTYELGHWTNSNSMVSSTISLV